MLKLNDLSFFYGALLRSILFIIIFFYILFPVCYYRRRPDGNCYVARLLRTPLFIVLQYSVLRT